MNITDFYSPNRGPIATPGEPGQVKPGAGLTVSPDGTLSVVTDSALSPDSSNPIQNGAVDAALKAKLDSPAGGTAGQVLTKTASGAEWKPAISDYVKSVNGMRGEVTLAVPEQVSDLPNDAGYQTAGEVTAAVSVKADKTALAAHAGDAGIHVTADDKAAWNAKADAASVPRKVSDLPNDAGYQTGDQVAAAVADKAAVSALAAHAGNAVIHVTAEQKSAWDAKADASSVITDTSKLRNDAGFQTKGEVDAAVAGKLDSPAAAGSAGDVLVREGSSQVWKPVSGMGIKSSELVNDSQFQTKGEVEAAVGAKMDDPGAGAPGEVLTMVDGAPAWQSVPRATVKSSELDNDLKFQTEAQLTAALSGKADVQSLAAHAADPVLHVTAEERSAWNAKADRSEIGDEAMRAIAGAGYVTGPEVDAKVSAKANAAELTGHVNDDGIHVSPAKKAEWDGKADKADIIRDTANLTNGAGFQTAADVNSLLSTRMPKPDNDLTAPVGFVLVKSGDDTTEWRKSEGGGSAAIPQVQADWNETSEASKAFIRNKPAIPTVNDGTVTLTQGGVPKGSFTLNQAEPVTIDLDAGGTGGVEQVQADWSVGDSSSKAFIRNKPAIGNGTITLTQGGVSKGSFTLNQSEPVTIDLDSSSGGTGSIQILSQEPELTDGNAGMVFQWDGVDGKYERGGFYKIEKNESHDLDTIVVKGNDRGEYFSNTYVGTYHRVPGTRKYKMENVNSDYCLGLGYPGIGEASSGKENRYFVGDVADSTCYSSEVADPSFSSDPILVSDLNRAGKFGSSSYVFSNPSSISIQAVPLNLKADWNESSEDSPAFIRNKPALATVATTGSYRDLTDQSELALKTDLDAKVNSPQGNGVAGQVLKSNGDGTTVWSDGGTGAVSDVHGIAVEVLKSVPSWTASDAGRAFQWHGTGNPDLVPGNIYRVEGKTETVTKSDSNTIIISGMENEYNGTYVNNGEGVYEKSGGFYLKYDSSINKYFIIGPNDSNFESTVECPGGTKNPIDLVHLQNSGKFTWVWNYKLEVAPIFSNPTTTETVTTYEPVLFNPASSGGSPGIPDTPGIQVSHLQLVKASNALHLEVRVAGSDGSFASATPLVNTADGTGIGKLRAYSETGEGGVWDEVTADGLSESYDGNPVSIDMTGVAVPSIVYYCWISAEGMRSPWHSTVFPSSGESSNHDSGIDQILAGKMDKPSTDGTAGQVLKSNGDGTASWSDAGSVDLSAHAENHDIHVTAEDKVKWNAKQDAITGSSKLQASLIDGLAAVATTGSYNSLSERPDIPAVNDTLVMVNQGGVLKRRFTLNQSEPVTIDLDAGGGGSVSVDSGSNTILNGTDGLKVNIDKVVTANNISYDSISAGSFYSLKAVEKFDMEHHGLPGFTFELASASSGASQVTVHPRGFDGSTGDVIVSDGFHPVIGVRTSKGNFYTVESGDCKFIEGYTRLNIWRYLAYDNASGMGSEWTAYLIG